MEEKREENRLLVEVLVLVPTHEEDKITHYLKVMMKDGKGIRERRL